MNDCNMQAKLAKSLEWVAEQRKKVAAQQLRRALDDLPELQLQRNATDVVGALEMFVQVSYQLFAMVSCNAAHQITFRPSMYQHTSRRRTACSPALKMQM